VPVPPPSPEDDLQPVGKCDGDFPVYPRLEDELIDERMHPNKRIAHILATCCAYSYADGFPLPTMMQRLGMKNLRCGVVEEIVDALLVCSSGYVLQSEDGRLVIVCYRGTKPLSALSWGADVLLQAPPIEIEFPGRMSSRYVIHGGFYRNMKATQPSIVRCLDRARAGKSIFGDERVEKPMQALYITGHSLGGALASLLAISLVTRDCYELIASHLRAVYTFGQPMIGGPTFAAECNQHEFLRTGVLRYVNDRDVVSALPPRAAGSYAHFGRQFTFRTASPHASGSGDWREDDTPQPQLSRISSLAVLPALALMEQMPVFRSIPFWDYLSGRLFSLTSHAPNNYVAALGGDPCNASL
jgi:hypothetical protein